MWPNKNNFSNFGISRKNIIEKNIIYINQKKTKISKKLNNYSIKN